VSILPLNEGVGLIVAAGLSAAALSGVGSVLPQIPGVPFPTTVVFPRGFAADVTVEERHRDRLTLTKNPVEQGASITDHAFKEPAELTVTIGFSNSSQQALGDPIYVQAVYNLMLLLQSARFPFGLITGKRIYSTLLIEDIEETTNQQWEYAMLLVITMSEIILVQTQVVSVPGNQVMQAPGITGATSPLGGQSLQPGTNYNAAASPVK
jgi:hypothetical protein